MCSRTWSALRAGVRTFLLVIIYFIYILIAEKIDNLPFKNSYTSMLMHPNYHQTETRNSWK